MINGGACGWGECSYLDGHPLCPRVDACENTFCYALRTHANLFHFVNLQLTTAHAAPMLQGAGIRHPTPDFKISNPFVTKLRDYESSMAGIYEKRSQYDQLFQNEHNHKNTNFMMIILLDVLLLYFTLVDSWQYGRKTRKGLGGY